MKPRTIANNANRMFASYGTPFFWLGKSRSILMPIEHTKDSVTSCYRVSCLIPTTCVPRILVALEPAGGSATGRRAAHERECQRLLSRSRASCSCTSEVLQPCRGRNTCAHKPQSCMEHLRPPWFHCFLASVQETEASQPQTTRGQKRCDLPPGDASPT